MADSMREVFEMEVDAVEEVSEETASRSVGHVQTSEVGGSTSSENLQCHPEKVITTYVILCHDTKYTYCYCVHAEDESRSK